ncbi:transcriptional repressor LexA [Wenzhouxiangella marina]|uniref:LexA repressor n=1 Tax=Wenzhouxiangella marina TaxID=1579979 RepID=A0A0K0XWU4_9GAMM|nr:transcriptional repressor LexA [Wenzhouxiangella marina]AKS42140.1 LexA family transcriptional regulator [Wenzhouxiangella marina]MBB6086088.1 repressor LexA [Wenzhouxiangella marina]
MKLTSRQREILDYILECKARDGLPPTRAEIVRHFGFRSPNAAQCHLRALAEHGAIRLVPGRARGIVPVDPPPTTPSGARLPLIGRVTAGTPVLAVENREDDLLIDPARFRPRPDFALRVEGDSMIGAGIQDGDLLLVHRTPEARQGQIVVARVGDEITVKRLRKQGEKLFLDPENPNYRPIPVDADEDFAIEGLGVGVIRSTLN